jgi:hypothetical protein
MICFFIHVSRTTSDIVGSRVVQVVCDKCRCEYHYLLSRLGSGHGISAYGLGGKAAEENATMGANKALTRRLGNDADLVPCPKCNWINDDLVNRYRRASYRGWIRTGWNLAAIGGSATFIGGCVNSHGAPGGAAEKVMIAGPLFFLVLWAGMAIAPMLLRARIQPNRVFPFPPTLPPGSPPALLMHAATGELKQPADGNRVRDEHEKIYFALGRDAFPPNCCRCAQECSDEWTMQIPALRHHKLSIPICKTCMTSLRRSQRNVGLFLAAATVIVFFGSWLVLKDLEAAFGFGIAMVVFSAMLYRSIAGMFSRPVKALTASHRRGVVRLSCRNAEYQRVLSQFLLQPRAYFAGEQADTR